MKRSGFLTLVCLVIVLSGCSKANPIKKQEVTARSLRIPSELVGLRVGTEDISRQTAKVKNSYADNIGMFSLREGDLLRATLEVAHLNALARPNNKGFQQSIVQLLGGSTPIPIRIGQITIYSTSGNKQNIFAWFNGRAMFVLTIHQDFEFPRTLLRKVVVLELR